MIQQNGDTVDTDATTPSDVIDLVNRDDDGDLPMSLASTPEDLKPVLNSPDLSITDYLLDFPASTNAQSADRYVGGGNNGSSNGTSTSGQNSLLSSTSGPGSSSFGTLESILPRDIMQMQLTTTDGISPFGTPNSTFAMQQVSQGSYPNLMHMRSQLDSLNRSEVARQTIPRNVRREPIAVQALGVPQQNSSRRVQANVLNPPSPNPQLNSASSNYQAHHVTNADSVITSMINGGGLVSRAPDGSSSLHLQSTQQVILC
jgi:E3 SUMO-protein ligase PIAS1